MRKESFFDALTRGVGDAVVDIREKIEEAFWGRVVNERDGSQAQPSIGWPQAQEVQPDVGDHQRESAADLDLDR